MRKFLRMTVAQRTEAPLGSLPVEPWGRRIKRAREDYAGLTLDEAVAAIGQFKLTSTGSLSRMESSEGEPTDRRRRELACVAAIVYGLDPGQFGVGSDDLPPGTVSQINATYEGLVSTIWKAKVLPFPTYERAVA